MKKVLILLLLSNIVFAQPAYHFDLLKDINTQTNDAGIKFIKSVGNTAVIFQVDRNYNTNTNKLRIWSYDGITLKNFASSELFSQNSGYTMCTVVDDYIFFYMYYNSPNQGLYVVKLGSSEIKKVSTIDTPTADSPTVFKAGSKIYYSNQYDEIYHYNELTNISTPIQPENAVLHRPTIAAISGNQVYFTALDNYEYPFTPYLWISDGTNAGTRKLKDTAQQTFSTNTNIGKVGSQIIFIANGSIYISDGTEAGTYPFISLNSFKSNPSDNLQIVAIYNAGDKAFLAIRVNGNFQLWETDGTAINTRFFTSESNICLLDNGEIAQKDGFIFFINNSTQLAKTNGSTVKILTDIIYYATYYGPLKMTLNPVDNKLYFNLFTKFYKTDGTTEGTEMISDKQAEPGGSRDYIPFVIAYNKILIHGVTIPASNYGKEIYEVNSDTVKIVKDLDSTTRNSRMQYIANTQGKSYFIAQHDESISGKVYETDGTSEGTIGIEMGDITLYTHFFLLNKTLFLVSNNQIRKMNFAANRYEVIITLPKSVTSVKPIEMDKKVYFVLGDHNGDAYRELWVTDGTSAGTALIKIFDESDRFHYFASQNQQLYVFSRAGNTTKVWKHINDSAPPVLVKTIDGNRIKATYANFRNKLAFLINTTDTSMQLWVTDGTANGTSHINTFPTENYYDLKNYYFTDNFYYYSAYTRNSNNTRIWKSDGTLSGTTLIADVPNATAEVIEFCQCNNSVFFGINRSANPQVSFLYKHELTSGTTTFINTTGFQWAEDKKKYYCLNGQLYFTTYGNKTGSNRPFLYTSDGTPEGTKDIVLMENRPEPLNGFTSGDLHPLNDRELLVGVTDKFYDYEWFTFRKCENPTSLNGTTTDSKIQSSSTFIESTEKLTGDGRVYYFAPKSITLKAGFSVENTNVFKAEIKNRACTLREGFTP